MSENKIDVTVSVEASLHAAMANVLQQIADEHGVRITEVDVIWRDYSTKDGPSVRAVVLKMVTMTSPVYAGD